MSIKLLTICLLIFTTQCYAYTLNDIKSTVSRSYKSAKHVYDNLGPNKIQGIYDGAKNVYNNINYDTVYKKAKSIYDSGIYGAVNDLADFTGDWDDIYDKVGDGLSVTTKIVKNVINNPKETFYAGVKSMRKSSVEVRDGFLYLYEITMNCGDKYCVTDKAYYALRSLAEDPSTSVKYFTNKLLEYVNKNEVLFWVFDPFKKIWTFR